MNLWHAATQVALYRRARHRAVRAEHVAIAREGLEPLATALAVIEELTGIGRHRLDSLMAAFGARERGLKLHIGFLLCTKHITGAGSSADHIEKVAVETTMMDWINSSGLRSPR